MSTVLIVEDHPAIVDGLRAGLSQVEGLTIQAVASSLAEARSVLRRSAPARNPGSLAARSDANSPTGAARGAS